MSEIITLKASASALISEESGYLDYNDHSSGSVDLGGENLPELLCSFPSLTEADRYKQVLGGTAWLYCGINDSSVTSSVFCRALSSSFAAASVTGRSYDSYTPYGQSHAIAIKGAEGNKYRAAELSASEAVQALKAGLSFSCVSRGVYYSTTAQTAYGSNAPKLDVSLGDVLGLDVLEQYPSAGSSLNVNKSCAFSLSWSSVTGALEEIRIAKLELQWRLSGAESFNSIELSAEEISAKSITVPAGTFPSGDIEYRFALSSNSGAISYGKWNALVTPEAVIYSYSPQAGARLNRLNRNAFSCYIKAEPTGNSFWLDGQSGSVLRWRVAGETTVNELPLSSAVNYAGVSVPGGTFPSGSIEYQFSVVDELGRTVESSWVTISTVDTISAARAVAPMGSVEDGERSIVMQWEHINESGTKPTQSEIQIAQPGEELAELAIVEGSALQYSAPAKTFASGEWRWRVRTYNIDGAAGAWSDEVSFVVIASPTTPILVLEDEGPRPEIRWQTNEQEGYELELDGVSLGTRFGAVQSWKSPDYLRDGQHSFRVRVQNVYGLWSEWGMVIFTVANEPGPEISLQGIGGREAKLQWQAAGYDFYIVYRNGTPIGKTIGTEWIDLLVVDHANYIVRGCYSDSCNYGESRELMLDVRPESLIIQMVSKVGTEGWISLRLSQTQHRVTKSIRGRTVKLLQLSGAAYPVAEPEDAQSLSIQVSCAFKDRAEGRVLETLTGKLVCVKTPHGERAIGYLQNLNKNGEEFYSSYSFTVQHLEFEEAIDIDA